MDRLAELRLFKTAAEELSFAGAGRRLNISPAAVTRGIARLEERLGTLLFHRTTRSVRLTEDGATFLEHCSSVLATLEEADRVFEARGAEVAGNLVVTAPVSFGRHHILPLLVELMKYHERLSVRLHLVDRNVRLVEEGIDAAVRIGEPVDSSLASVRLAHVKPVFVASKAYLEGRGTPAGPADLHRHDLIQFEGLDRSTEWRFRSRRRSYIRFAPRLVVNNAEAAAAAAEAGIGIARLLSYQVADALREGRLIRLLGEQEGSALPVSLLFESRRRGSRNIRALIDAARVRFASVEM